MQRIHEEDLTDLDRDLARIRGLLEQKWANDEDAGFSFIYTDGTRLPLTPHMLFQWALAIVSLILLFIC